MNQQTHFQAVPYRLSVALLVLFLQACAHVTAPVAEQPESVEGPGVIAFKQEGVELKVKPVSSPDEGVREADAGQAQEQGDQKNDKQPVPAGIIFAKTVFEGVVKTSYVQLTIVNEEDPPTEFQLFVGDKARQQEFFWSVQTVKPGYFFISLPAGHYRISSISIPVGTTKATEEMNVTFEVHPGKAVYLGTLHVIGTKEKVKLGGVPVIRPSFEYEVQVFDERVEALNEFREQFPDSKKEIVYSLFQVNPLNHSEKMKTINPEPVKASQAF